MQTQWFEGTTKPSVEGVYKRKLSHTPPYWAKFENGSWYASSGDYETARTETEISPVQDSFKWAGCTETDWISGQILPFHEGVYKRRITGECWAKFKNGQWYMAYSDYEAAKKASTPSKQQNLFPWKAIHCE